MMNKNDPQWQIAFGWFRGEKPLLIESLFVRAPNQKKAMELAAVKIRREYPPKSPDDELEMTVFAMIK